MKDKRMYKVKFDDETQTIYHQWRGVHDGKATASRSQEHVKDKKAYFKRKLQGE